MAFLGLFVFGVFVIALLYNGGAAIENKINEHKKKLEEDAIIVPTIGGFLVHTNSDAERVHNLEKLTVRFGKHEGKTWAQVPTEYLTWMVHEDHKYVQLARVILAARRSNYTFV
ncbi:hypothetical protein HPY09_20940 (plasmid) [Vibrio cholerae]|uniref:putative quorum-sensing-regulated virulence factor n=1 Tax=Vibrio cholerae TaxID=666 RepID=UPI001181EB58|nr:DUF3820 family protein [Vibrio cholerae]EJL6460768.1 DUF3820 family protein [Vibrio cholerae]MBJ6954279.1 DUF3820 family protein [Vibrio cholerae]MVC22284.1 hypothetical protein [Vibrio cholerae]QKU73401.1 hypothetical protein HPY09_20940 [Vibrio cholerae]QKU77102.1 hypothetical protein HPY05_19565 [Vibrio cholerae]